MWRIRVGRWCPYCGLIGPVIDYPTRPLRGSVVVLRPFRKDDFDAAVAAGDDVTSAWGSSLPASDGAGVVAYFDECRRDGVLLHFVVADRTTDEYLGEAMIVFGEHAVGEVGCLISPGARRRGFAVDALELLVDWAFATLGLARIQVFVAATNAAGLALVARAGFRREGVLRSYLELDGQRIDAVVCSRLPGE